MMRTDTICIHAPDLSNEKMRRILTGCRVGKRYFAKKEEMPELEHKPGRFWGVIGRKNLPFGKREDREVSAKEAVQLRRFMRRYRWANTPPEKRKFLRKSQLWLQDFTAKLFCNIEFWLKRLPRLIGLAETKRKMKPPVAVEESDRYTR